jgi:oxygen-independent coproporphyrinogen-3 oxidase
VFKSPNFDAIARLSDLVAQRAPVASHVAERQLLRRLVPGLVDDGPPRALEPLDPSALLGPQPIALYLHIPFCASVCSYCMFNRSANRRSMDRYVDCLLREIELYGQLPRLRGSALSSLYIGGGTPSLLAPQIIERLVARVRSSFALMPDFQASIEATPDSLDDRKLGAMVDACIERVSIGVQSFDDDLLAGMSRRHTGDDAARAIAQARAAGLMEVSVDLIYGLDSQRPEEFVDGVRHAIDAGVTHFSMFPLVDKGGRLPGAMRRRVQDACYEGAIRCADAAGYRQYSTEDFTRSAECRYETDAWRVPRIPVLGLGLSALTSLGGHFWANEARLSRYMDRLERDEFPVAGGHPITANQEALRSLFMGLKYRELSLAEIRQAHDAASKQALEIATGALCALGFVRRRGDLLKLTGRGERFGARNFASIVLGQLERHARPSRTSESKPATGGTGEVFVAPVGRVATS